MSDTRKARIPMAEQIRLINECRQSSMTDANWCHENGIAVSILQLGQPLPLFGSGPDSTTEL